MALAGNPYPRSLMDRWTMSTRSIRERVDILKACTHGRVCFTSRMIEKVEA